MNSRQKAFADYYIECGNATEAAKKAGYSERSARQMGAENLTKPYILEYIQSRTAPTEQKRIASGDEVLQFFTRVMNGEEKDAFGLDVSVSDRMAAGREILKRDIADKKLEIELLKLERSQGEAQREANLDDALLEALNGAAVEVWGGEDNGGTADGCTEKEDSG